MADVQADAVAFLRRIGRNFARTLTPKRSSNVTTSGAGRSIRNTRALMVRSAAVFLRSIRRGRMTTSETGLPWHNSTAGCGPSTVFEPILSVPEARPASQLLQTPFRQE
jgi:hypothetical protein